MKAIPLTDDNVTYLFKNELTSDALHYFISNQSEYKHIWKHQNHEFWIKFVTSLRNKIFDHKYFKPKVSDTIFIEFLKKLTGKSFDPLLKQIIGIGEKLKHKPKKNSCVGSDLEKEHSKCNATPKNVELPQSQYEQRFVLESHCAAAFIKLHGPWKLVEDGTKVEWQEPYLWRSKVYRAQPFEEFLKGRWKAGLLTKINHTEEEIGWWNERPLVKTLSKPVQQSPESHKKQKQVQQQKAQTSTNKVQNSSKPPESCSAKTSKAFSSKKQETTLSDSYSFHKSKNEKWLPEKCPRLKYISLPETNEMKNYNFYEMLLQRGDGYDCKWFSLEELLPPLLHKKFHIVNPDALYEAQTDMHHLATCAWFTSWCASFGTSLMEFLQIQIKELDNVDVLGDFPYLQSKSSVENSWMSEMNSIVSALTEVQRSQWSRPGTSECVESAKEFLLEPCVIIQLPWQPAMLQQWLGAALIEIMKFEVESMELRYWPLEEGSELEECARELIWMISCAKQRVLLGLYLLASQAQNNLIPSPLIPSLLMDSVILPAIPVLQFLCSGEALLALIDLKCTAFVKPHPIEKSVTLPESAFLVHDNLQEFYANHHWHMNFWLSDENLEPYPYMDGNMNYREVLGHLRVGVPSPNEALPKQTPDISKEESVVHELWVSLNFENKVLADVLKNIADPRRVLKILCKLGFYSKADEDKLCSLILDNKSNNFCLKGFMKYSELFALTTLPLNGIDQHDTVLSWLVRLSGEVLERGQLARIVASCSLLLGQSPTLPGVEQVLCLYSPSYWLQITRQIQAQVSSVNRTWLWQQLPLSWRDTVTPVNDAPKLRHGLERIASDLGVRVGKIITGIAQNSFMIHDKGCEGFKRWQIVQYVVPGFITTLLDVAKNINTPENQPKIKNLVVLMHTMVKYYEEKYIDWLKYAPLRETKKLHPYFSKDNNFREYTISKLVVTNNQLLIRHNRIIQFLNAYVGLSYECEGIPGFEAWVDGTTWIIASNPTTVWNGAVAILTKALIDHCLPSFDDLYKICNEAWNIPEPGSQLRAGPMLSKIYLASSALEEIRGQIIVQGIFQPALAKTKLHSSVCDKSINPEGGDWRNILMSLVAQSEEQVSMQRNVTLKKIELFAADGQNILLELWSVLANLRKLAKEWKYFDVVMITQPNEVFSKVANLINLYKSGKVAALERSLDLVTYCGEGAGVIRHDMKPASLASKDSARSFQHAPSMASDTTMDPKSSQIGGKSVANNNEAAAIPPVLQKCHQCNKVEEKPGSFTMCRECKKQKYPDPNFYCSLPCQNTRWTEEHFAEHLEFELGLM